MKVNLSDVESKGFVLYDSGAYRVKIESIEEVTAASSGNNQLRVKTTFCDGDYSGKQLTDHITLIESVAWKLKSFFESLKMPTDIDVDTDSGAFRNILNKTIGKTCVWIVGQKADREGTLRNEVKAYQVDPSAVDPTIDEPDFLAEGGTETAKWPE